MTAPPNNPNMSESGDNSRYRRLGRLGATRAAGEIVRAFVPPVLPPDSLIDILGLLPHLIASERAPDRLDNYRLKYADSF